MEPFAPPLVPAAPLGLRLYLLHGLVLLTAAVASALGASPRPAVADGVLRRRARPRRRTGAGW